MSSPAPDVPAPLTVAASLTAVEGLGLLLLAALEAAAISGERLGLGVATAVFFALLGGGAMLVGWALRGGRGWARGPAMMLQLVGLLMAWSLRSVWPVVVALVVVCGIALVGLLHPRSIEVLTRDRF